MCAHQYCTEISSNVELWWCHDISYKKHAKGEYIDVCVYIIEITTDDKLRRYWHNVTMVALNNIPHSYKYIMCTCRNIVAPDTHAYKQ